MCVGVWIHTNVCKMKLQGSTARRVDVGWKSGPILSTTGGELNGRTVGVRDERGVPSRYGDGLHFDEC